MIAFIKADYIDRHEAAIELHRNSKVDYILISGDNCRKEPEKRKRRLQLNNTTDIPLTP